MNTEQMLTLAYNMNRSGLCGLMYNRCTPNRIPQYNVHQILSEESDLLRRSTAGSIIEDSGFKFT